MKIENNGNLVLGPFDESTPCLMIVLMNCQTKLRINHLTAVKSVAILESRRAPNCLSLLYVNVSCFPWINDLRLSKTFHVNVSVGWQETKGAVTGGKNEDIHDSLNGKEDKSPPPVGKKSSGVKSQDLGGQFTGPKREIRHELCDMLRRLVGTTAPGHHDGSIQE
ncbi:alpha-2 adrenergic receptor [Trichonephila clavipes]|nr:alpha-2 adrenergic receptor [Trichonephila clavipes]